MTPEHNEYVLSTSYHSGWINLDQYHSAVAALQAMPHLSAIDFLLEQTIINPGQAEGLRQALEQAIAAAKSTKGKIPAVKAAVPPAAAPEKSRADVEVTPSNDLPDG